MQLLNGTLCTLKKYEGPLYLDAFERLEAAYSALPLLRRADLQAAAAATKFEGFAIYAPRTTPEKEWFAALFFRVNPIDRVAVFFPATTDGPELLRTRIEVYARGRVPHATIEYLVKTLAEELEAERESRHLSRRGRTVRSVHRT